MYTNPGMNQASGSKDIRVREIKDGISYYC